MTGRDLAVTRPCPDRDPTVTGRDRGPGAAARDAGGARAGGVWGGGGPGDGVPLLDGRRRAGRVLEHAPLLQGIIIIFIFFIFIIIIIIIIISILLFIYFN